MENKTQPTSQSLDEFLQTVDPQRIDDCRKLTQVMQEVSGFLPVLWGTGGIIGFGQYHYKYASGRQGDAPLIGFSPRKDKFSIYAMCAVKGAEDLVKKLGKCKTGAGCIYFKKVDDIDLNILKQILKFSINYTRKLYPDWK